MGFIVPTITDETTGLQVQNAYVALARNPVVLCPGDGQYTVSTIYNVWVSKTEKDNGKRPIDTRSFEFAWTPDPIQPAVDVYPSIYRRLKDLYPGVIDVFEDPTPTEESSFVEENEENEENV
jgi:hypothetical protein